MTRTLSVTVGYLPQPFATPADDAAGDDAAAWTIDVLRALADIVSGADQADAVLSSAGPGLGVTPLGTGPLGG